MIKHICEVVFWFLRCNGDTFDCHLAILLKVHTFTHTHTHMRVSKGVKNKMVLNDTSINGYHRSKMILHTQWQCIILGGNIYVTDYVGKCVTIKRILFLRTSVLLLEYPKHNKRQCITWVTCIVQWFFDILPTSAKMTYIIPKWSYYTLLLMTTDEKYELWIIDITNNQRWKQ